MPMRRIALHIGALVVALLTVTTACSQLNMPRLTNSQPRQPVIPASVTLSFDDSVRTAILEHTVCGDILWKGRLGDAIMKAFEKTGQARFAQVTIAEPVETPRPVSSPSPTAITAAIKMSQSSFARRTRTGDDDNFISQLDIRMVALFQDTMGQQYPEAPLAYSEQVKIWTPQYGGGNQCSTGQLDGAVNKAAEHLADQFTGYVAELTTKTQGQTVADRQNPGNAPPRGTASRLTVRATLLDENNNLVLEGGEKVGIRIDVTNNGANASGPMTASLAGTPVLIEAFAGQLTQPVRISNLEAGETTSTMMWGRLPAQLEGTRGELTVTVSPSEATGSAATQTVVVAIVPSGKNMASAPSPGIRQAPASSSQGHDPDRYAVIVGLSLYRSPWPGWRDGLSFNRKGIVTLFTNSLNVPGGQTLLLEDELAGQTDIEEALSQWLPKRVTKNSTVFFYFAGQSVADPKTGEVFLLPYDATPASSPYRLISLRFLQSRLQKLGAKLALAILDSPTTMAVFGKDGKMKPVAPNWMADLDGTSGANDSSVVQVSRIAGTAHRQQGLLQGLTGPADLDHDGTITVSEWLRSLRGSAITVPTLPPPLALQSIPLAHIQQRTMMSDG